MNARAIVAAFLFAIPCAAPAADPVDWPPSPAVQKRMTELQATLHDPASTLDQRDKAREELTRLLKSKSARDEVEKADDVKRPPRAAIDPYPSVVKPLAPLAPRAPAPPVAHIDIVEPPKPAIIQRSGVPAVPSTGAAVDPTTGQILHQTPNGYINPRTGEFIPR